MYVLELCKFLFWYKHNLLPIIFIRNFVKSMQSIYTTLGMLSKIITSYRENKEQLVRRHYNIGVQNIGMIYLILLNHHIIYMHLPNC